VIREFVNRKEELEFLEREFWFRFVYPNRSDVEGGNVDRALTKIREEFNPYVGMIFEQVCQEFLDELNHRAGLPFHFAKIGNWWGHFREDGVRKEIEKEDVILFDLKDMEKYLKSY